MAVREPFRLPPHRLAEARRIATQSGWPASCPDPLCAKGCCSGRLRAVVEGDPRSIPTCLAIAIRMRTDPDGCTLREADAYLGFVHPGEGWTLGPVPPELDGPDEPAADDNGPLGPAEALIGIATVLAVHGGG